MIAAIDANAGRSVGSSRSARHQAATAAVAVCTTATMCGRTRRRTVVAAARGEKRVWAGRIGMRGEGRFSYLRSVGQEVSLTNRSEELPHPLAEG